MRVHGVKGFDNVLKSAARLATTERFITVDADNQVRNSFFDTAIEATHPDDLVYSYNAYNVVNGLVYGNGSVKIWPRDLVLRLHTHENALHGHDYCWTYRYWQVNHVASEVYHAQSPLHAFRAGYREAVKLSLDQDVKLTDWATAQTHLYPPNLSRLLIWATIGRDQPNGIWSIYGARIGLSDLWLHNLDPDRIADFDWLAERWQRLHTIDSNGVVRLTTTAYYTELLPLERAFGLPNLDATASRWFKQVFINPPREDGLMVPGMLAPQ